MNRIFPTFLLTAVVSLLFVFCSRNDDNSVNKEEEETTDYDLSSLLSKFEGTGLSYAIARTGYFADDDFKKTQDEAAFIHTENFILVETVRSQSAISQPLCESLALHLKTGLNFKYVNL